MKSLRLLAPTAALALILSGCGTTEEAVDPDSESTGSSGESMTVTDSRGEDVVLEDGPATEVVTLEWVHTEMAVSLGVTPVGAADLEGYATWNAAEPLDDSVVDVGMRGEPSMDAIGGLEPDVILVEGGTDPQQITQLETYAPVLVVETADASDAIGAMRSGFEAIAAATGTEERAAEVLDEFDQTIADATAAVEEAGASGSHFLMADGFMEGSTVAIRLFGDGSYIDELAESIGLVNAWEGEVDDYWGLSQTDIEGLADGTRDKDDVTFLYSASTDDVFTTGLADNPIWSSLPFVANGDVVKLDTGTWTFGGPRSGESLVEQFAAAVTS